MSSAWNDRVLRSSNCAADFTAVFDAEQSIILSSDHENRFIDRTKAVAQIEAAHAQSDVSKRRSFDCLRHFPPSIKYGLTCGTVAEGVVSKLWPRCAQTI